MDIIINYHNLSRNKDPHEFDENNMKLITRIPNMDKHISIDCDFINFLHIADTYLFISLSSMPHRIDFDAYLGTLRILGPERAADKKPYWVLPKYAHLVSTLWELGEREQATQEEVGEPLNL